MKNKVGIQIIFALWLFAALAAPALALGPTPQSAPADNAQATPPAAEAASDAPRPEKANSAENINVELKVPLPFVKTTDGKVQSLKDYIEGVYRLLIGAGALFAVVMIIIAGYQWMLNGGSAGQVGDAKKRIWNATIGLVLALLSYVILNTISARLVELHLPKVDPVPAFYGVAEGFCQTDKEIEKLYKASTDQPHFLTEIGGTKTEGVDITDALCGKKYNIAGGKGQCLGNVCPEAYQSCLKNKCGSKVVHGTIEWRPSTGRAFVDKVTLYAICDNDLSTIGAVDVPEKGGSYEVVGEVDYQYNSAEQGSGGTAVEAKYTAAYQKAYDDCLDKRKTFSGYVLEIEVNDDTATFTNDDDFAVGNNCTEPLKPGNVYDFDSIDWNLVKPDSLISHKNLEVGSYQCNLLIDRVKFPAR